MPRLSALIVFFLAHILVAKGQNPAVYNINKYNGLSTNHVYSTLVDKHGYLWLATTDGVYRYNGYALQRYDYNDGLTNTDVWDMYEDREGRIWLMSIARGIGYIQNNVFRPAIIKDDSVVEKIYPGTFMENDSFIFFYLKNTAFNNVSWGVIRGDTIEIRKDSINPWSHRMHLASDKVIIASDSLMHIYSTDILTGQATLKRPLYSVKSAIRHISDFSGYQLSRINKNIIYYSNPKTDNVVFYDFDNNQIKTIFLHSAHDELISHVHTYKDVVYSLTNHNIFGMSLQGEMKDTFSYHKLFPSVPVSNFNAVFFMPDSFWGKCLSTNNDGLYINSWAYAPLPVNVSLADYKYISDVNDSVGYWWNDRENKIAQISGGKISKIQRLRERISINKIIPYNNHKSLLLTSVNLKWLHKNGAMVNFMQGIDTLIYNGSTLIRDTSFSNWLSSLTDAIVIDNSNFIILGTAFMGLAHVMIDTNGKKVYVTGIDRERCKGLLYYSKLDCYLSYSSDKLLIYSLKNRTKTVISSKLLRSLNIQSIREIVTDEYGNLIIQTYDKLLLFNPLTCKLSGLLRNYNFQNSFISINGNTLSVAGNFGVIRCNTTVDGSVNNIHTFPNTKTLFYKYIYDVQFSKKSVLLKTDNGAYLVKIDSTGIPVSDAHKLIINNKNILSGIGIHDTLNVDQATEALGIDIIKPTGTGNLVITYSINGSASNNTGNQIILPTLIPGSYNTVSLIASDDSWRSKPMNFTIYIQPKWWQTQTAKRVIFVLSLLAFIGFIYLVIVMTRRIVNRNNERRNQRRELELKSIYSQINPHFIFNSLSTAQYFVKKNKNKEAFEHINQFSDLLRAYIKSSRAKYITIAEEIDNLENYLQLQLTRFEEKFDYNITIDASVNPEKVKIPSLLLQPLVENALNHGIFHSETKGDLNISFKVDEQDKDTLICMVDDNGVGRQKSKELRGKIIRKADSYGTILIKELIDTFNKYEKINIEIEYTDKQPPQSGTTVTVRIKNYAQIP